MDAVGCAEWIRQGGVIAYPTEGVWGLGCDPQNQAAVLRLLALKQREVSKGLILIAAEEAQLAPYIALSSLTEGQRAAMRASWPGPHTWVVPASAAAPAWITGDHDSIAVRISAHPQVRALCMAFAGALVSTSANLANQPAAHHRQALDKRIIAGVDAVSEGETLGDAQPSRIRDARTGAILR